MKGIFAKIFEKDGEQILVTKDDADDGSPAVRVTVLLNPPLGFCNTCFTCLSKAARDKAFEKIDSWTSARECAADLFRHEAAFKD